MAALTPSLAMTPQALHLASVQMQLESPQFGMQSPVASTAYPPTPEPSPPPAVFPSALTRHGSAVPTQHAAGGDVIMGTTLLNVHGEFLKIVTGGSAQAMVGVCLYDNRRVDVVPGTNAIVGRLEELREDELPMVIISTPLALGGSGPFYQDSYYNATVRPMLRDEMWAFPKVQRAMVAAEEAAREVTARDLVEALTQDANDAMNTPDTVMDCGTTAAVAWERASIMRTPGSTGLAVRTVPTVPTVPRPTPLRGASAKQSPTFGGGCGAGPVPEVAGGAAFGAVGEAGFRGEGAVRRLLRSSKAHSSGEASA